MRINLISRSEYAELLRIQNEFPKLTFQNKGYQYIKKDSFDDADKEAFDKVTEILKRAIVGFSEFNNFNRSENGTLRVRVQYNYGAAEGTLHFTGVGYVSILELHYGFSKPNKSKSK